MYPRLEGFSTALCSSNLSAAIRVSPSASLIAGVKVFRPANVLFLESRFYPFPESGTVQGFFSARVSTRNNVGIGLGISTIPGNTLIMTHVFGVTFQKSGEPKPFVGFSIGLDLL